MSRDLSELLPDVLLSASGCPPMVALQALSSSTRQFLEETDVWKVWVPAIDTVADQAVYPFHAGAMYLADPTQEWLRVKTLDALIWAPTGREIVFAPAQQLQGMDPKWRTRTAAVPSLWTYEIDGGASAAKQIRLYPTPTEAVVGALEARLVITTHTYSGMGVTATDAQPVVLPEELFHKFRDALVCGALARLHAMPRRDWTDFNAAMYHKSMFDKAVISAKSEGDVDHGDPVLVVDYGGL